MAQIPQIFSVYFPFYSVSSVINYTRANHFENYFNLKLKKRKYYGITEKFLPFPPFLCD